MKWFSAFRGEFGNTYYSEFRTAVTWDIPFVAVIYSCILISIAVLISAAGIRGKERWYTLLRMIYTLLVGTFILLGIFGYCWQLGEAEVDSQYIYRSPEHFEGTLGIRIALRKVNVTLTGSFAKSVDNIYYNELIHLDEVGGPVVEMRKCLERGLPHPVLGVVEYLTADAGGLRWGRSYRLAGYFTNILLWTAFAFWLISNLIMGSVVFYGAFMFMLTGITMVISAIVYHVLQPEAALRLICARSGVTLHYGWCFWAVLIFGILTTLTGLLIIALDSKMPGLMSTFFMVDSMAHDDEFDSRKESTASLRTVCADQQSYKVNWYLNQGFVHGGKSNPIENEVFRQTNVLNVSVNEKLLSPKIQNRNTVDLCRNKTDNYSETSKSSSDHSLDANHDLLQLETLRSNNGVTGDTVVEINELISTRDESHRL